MRRVSPLQLADQSGLFSRGCRVAQKSGGCPSATASTGSAGYAMTPRFIVVIQVLRIPERQPNIGTIPDAPASSSSEPISCVRSAVMADLAERTEAGGLRFRTVWMSGFNVSALPNDSKWTCSEACPRLSTRRRPTA